MAKTKKQKKEMINEIEDGLDKQKSVYFIDYKGVKADDLFKIRKEIKEKGGRLYVTKKTLAETAFDNKKIKLPEEQTQGQLALVFSFEDEIAPAKTIYNHQEEAGAPTLLGAMLEGKFLSQEKTIELAQLPSLKELHRKLVGSLQAPLRKLQRSLVNPATGLHTIIKGRMSMLKNESA